MNNQRHTDRLECLPRQLRPRLGCRRWQLIAEHMREADAGLLEDRAIAQDAAQTAAAARSLPRIAFERRFAVKLLEFGNNAALQRLQIFLYLIKFIHRVIAIVFQIPGR